MDWFLLRHGESTANADQRLQGQQDAPLSPIGRGQARAVGLWCRNSGLQWRRVYVSPLQRARETASLLIAAMESEPELAVCEELCEIGAGDLEGHTVEELRERFPEFRSGPITEYADFSRFGGESYEQVQGRVAQLYDRIRHDCRSAQETVLLVAHGGLIRQVVKYLVTNPVPSVVSLKTSNCALTRIAVRETETRTRGELVWHVPFDLMVRQTLGGQ